MAFGDLVQIAPRQDSSQTTTTNTFGAAPTSGNIIVFGSVNGSASRTMSVIPVGFAEINSEFGGNQNQIWWWKLSDGAETTRSAVWSGSGATSTYVEFEWDGSTPTSVQINADASFISTNTNTMPSGALTPTSSVSLALAFHSTDRQQFSSGGQAIDGSWIEDDSFSFEVQAGGKISSLVNSTGSQEATHTDTDTGDTMWGAIVVFNTTGGAAANPKGPLGMPFHGPFGGPI